MAARKSSNKQPARPGKRKKASAAATEMDRDELSPSQLRELELRIKDLDDRTRYMLVSTLGPSFVLYYNVSEDTYGWNDPEHATLFKRRKAAEAIQRLLGDKDGIVECAVDKRGKLVKRTVKVAGRASNPGGPGKRSAKRAPKRSRKTQARPRR